MTTQTDLRLTVQGVQETLRRLGMVLTVAPGEYRVNFSNGRFATAYSTDDLADALATGLAMAPTAPVVLPPLGPTGSHNSRRAMMYRHNARIAVARRFGKGPS